MAEFHDLIGSICTEREKVGTIEKYDWSSLVVTHYASGILNAHLMARRVLSNLTHPRMDP